MAVYSRAIKSKLFIGSKKIKKAYKGNQKIYSAGNIVTYQIDSGVSYTEEVDSDASCLSPITFTPTKDGWTFVGWCENTAADSNVLKEKVMGDDPIVLYAVFTQDVTVTYYNNSKTPGKWTGKRYYNNGNVENPSVTLTQSAVSGWAARGWSTGTAGDDDIFYKNATSYKVWEDVTVYGMYQKTVTLSYNGNSATSGSTASQTGTAYRNYAGTVVGASITLRSSGFARTYYTFVRWAKGSASGTQYAASSIVIITEDTTFYAVWNASVWITGSNFVLDPKTFTKESGDASMSFTSPAAKIYASGGYGTRIMARSGKLAVDKLRTIKLTWKRTGSESQPVFLSVHDQNNAGIEGLKDLTTAGTYTVTIPDSVTSICFFVQIYNDEGIEITSAVLS